MSATTNRAELPWLARAILIDAAGVERGLERLRASGAFGAVPNSWQITLGVLRMWHRIAFRSETIGTSSAPTRRTLRARLLGLRPLRFPALLRERAIAPLDSSGLLSTRERVLRHLLGAHHDRNQFAYDLEMLLADPGALEELEARADAVVRGADPRAEWLRDLVVFEGYHEALLAAVRRALDGDFGLSEAERLDPDISFGAYLAWCARQPATPRETIDAALKGHFQIARGIAC